MFSHPTFPELVTQTSRNRRNSDGSVGISVISSKKNIISDSEHLSQKSNKLGLMTMIPSK